MNITLFLVVMLATGSILMAFIVLNEDSEKKHLYKSAKVLLVILGILLFVTIFYFGYMIPKNTKKHFHDGKLLKCYGRLDNYLVSNKTYKLIGDNFIKEERVLSLENCSRIK